MLIQYFWFALVVIILLLLGRNGTFTDLLDRVTKISGAGIDFEFTQISALKTKDSVEGGLRPIKATIDRGVEADVRAKSLQQVFGSILDAEMVGLRYRATVHVPDPLFENWLYQVLDYHPNGGGRGRRFDSRGGLVGLAWRTGKTTPLRQTQDLTVDELVEKWSMTRREATARQVDRTMSLLAVVLTDTDSRRRIGILYLDSEDPNAFGADKDAMIRFGNEISEACKPDLTTPLTELVTNALRNSPQLVLENII